MVTLQQITAFLSRPFSILDPPQNRIFLILFCGVFASIFLFVFNPLNSHDWKFNSYLGYDLPIWSAGLLAIPILAISQFIIRPSLVRGIYTNKYFIISVLLELCILFLMFYLIFGDKHPLGQAFIQEFVGVVKHTLMLSVLPYALALMILMLRKKEQARVSIQEQEVEQSSLLLHLQDENNKLVLTVDQTHLLYIKAEDNYVAVYYLHQDKLKKQLLRTNLKKLGKELADSPLLRVHRSFMVNIDQLISVNPKARGYALRLKNLPDANLSVSQSYSDAFEAAMGLREQQKNMRYPEFKS